MCLSGFTCLFPDFQENAFSFPHLIWCFQVVYHWWLLSVWDSILYLIFSACFSTMNGYWILSKTFLHFLRWLCDFILTSIYMMLYLLIYTCWTIFASLWWSQLDHSLYNFLIICSILFAVIFVSIFVSMFTKKFYFLFCQILSCFKPRVVLCFRNGCSDVSSPSVSWKTLRCIDNRSSLNSARILQWICQTVGSP